MFDIPVYFTTESEAKEFMGKVQRKYVSLKRCLELGGRDSHDIPDAFSLLGWYGIEGGWNIVYDRMLADYHVEAPEPVALYFNEIGSSVAVCGHLERRQFALPRGIDFRCSRRCNGCSREEKRDFRKH